MPGILETLKNEEVKATFFIVGQWAEKFPDVVKQVALEGHDVANHSYSHLRMSTLSSPKMQYEISACGEKLSEMAGKKVDLLRTPYGDYNDRVVSTARNLGYYTIQWDVDAI